MSDRPESAEPFDWSKLNTRRGGAASLGPRLQSGTGHFEPTQCRTVLEVIAMIVVVGGTLCLIGWAMFRDRSDEESLKELQDRLRYQEIISAPKRLADEMYERDPELKRLKQEMASDDPEASEKAYQAAYERMNRVMTDEELEFYNADPADLLRREESP